MPCSGREISFPYTAQRAERDGQGTGEEEDHIPHQEKLEGCAGDERKGLD